MSRLATSIENQALQVHKHMVMAPKHRRGRSSSINKGPKKDGGGETGAVGAGGKGGKGKGPPGSITRPCYFHRNSHYSGGDACNQGDACRFSHDIIAKHEFEKLKRPERSQSRGPKGGDKQGGGGNGGGKNGNGGGTGGDKS